MVLLCFGAGDFLLKQRLPGCSRAVFMENVHHYGSPSLNWVLRSLLLYHGSQ